MNNTICFFNSTKTWGGGEKWHFEMASYLHEKGIKVLAIVSPNSELSKKFTEKNIPQEKIKISNFSFLNYKKVHIITSFYKKHNVNTVVLNSSEDMKLGGLAANESKLTRIIYRRGSAIPIKNSFINRYFFKNILTEVLANSEATKATINAKNHNLFPKNKITVIPNGIDTKSYLEKVSQPLYKKLTNEFVIGNLGRLVVQKNQSFLLDVVKELLNRSLPIKLVIGGSGKLENELKEKAENLNIVKNIVFTGFVKNPKDLMSSCDIFVLSSFWEGFGYVIAEALLCKKPVVAFNVSSNPELVINKENGFLVPLNNVEFFCDKIQYFYENKQEIEIMGELGKLKITSENDTTVIFNKVEDYLTKRIL